MQVIQKHLRQDHIALSSTFYIQQDMLYTASNGSEIIPSFLILSDDLMERATYFNRKVSINGLGNKQFPSSITTKNKSL